MLTVTLALVFVSQTAVPTPAPSPIVAQAGEEKKICRKEPTLGSRIGGRRVCRTDAEWRAINAATMENVRSGNDR